MKINRMMWNSAEPAQLWPHSFIILTQGPALTLHEADRGQEEKKKKKNTSADSRPQSRASFLLMYMYIPFINTI